MTYYIIYIIYISQKNHFIFCTPLKLSLFESFYAGLDIEFNSKDKEVSIQNIFFVIHDIFRNI